MSRRRWIADEVSGNRAALTGEHAEHLSRVLRARVGQQFEIATGENVRRGHVTDMFILAGVAVLAYRVPMRGNLFTLALVMVIGAAAFAGIGLLIASRTETHLAAAAPKRVERWQRIALQASEQSRHNSPPQIDQPLKLTAAVTLPGTLRIALAESEQQTMLREVLHTDSARDIVLAFGPEGGWTESELELFGDAGWISASLGNTILRVETAAIAALAVTLSELG